MTQLLEILRNLHTEEGTTIWYGDNTTLEELIAGLSDE